MLLPYLALQSCGRFKGIFASCHWHGIKNYPLYPNLAPWARGCSRPPEPQSHGESVTMVNVRKLAVQQIPSTNSMLRKGVYGKLYLPKPMV